MLAVLRIRGGPSSDSNLHVLSLPVDLASMADLHNQNNELAISDGIDHTKISDSEAVEILLAFQLLHTARARVSFQLEETFRDLTLRAFREASELAFGGWRDVNPVGQGEVLHP